MGKNYQEALKLRAKRSSNPIEDYFAGDNPRLAALRKLTLENIFDRPLEVGQMVSQRIRQLAVTQGFVISEHQDKDNAYLQGKVISKGELVESIEKGDIVWYNKHSGHSIEWNKKLYYVIKYGDIVIVE